MVVNFSDSSHSSEVLNSYKEVTYIKMLPNDILFYINFTVNMLLLFSTTIKTSSSYDSMYNTNQSL